MAITFKPKIILLFFYIADTICFSAKYLLNILIIFVLIVFFCLGQPNIERAVAEEENSHKCIKLKDPKSVLELKELRVCLDKENLINNEEKRIRIIKRSYKGSLELTEKINMRSDNKSLKKVTEES